LELSTGLLTTASAGHEYPAICRADGQFEFFKDRHGFVLGGMSGSRYKEETLTLLPGDTLFVYTDGVTDATDKSLHLFGTERLLETLNQTPNAAPTDLLNNMSAAIYNFANGMEQADDITMLALRYFGQQNHLRTLRIDATKENLTEVSAWIEEMLQILDVPMKEQMQIQLAAEEIYINIANYAYAPGTGCQFPPGPWPGRHAYQN
ncbi:MAG: SpoIIE family protein phosphatase, partial [Selenomonas sp.]|nr:SpoIIE family protein phosphatase [Selenomonas sp.]